jgi:RNA 2',3'-cyclic 3'-phosphodiesterase
MPGWSPTCDGCSPPVPSSRAATQRLFVAIDPSTQAVADLAAVVDTLEVSRANAPGHSTRLTRRDGWHLTVAFLGDVAVDQVSAAANVVQTVGSRSEPLRLSFVGGGTFGRGRHAILWAGVDGDVTALLALGHALRLGLHKARLPVDQKPLRPHLTISRPGARVTQAQVAADVQTLSAYVGPQWTVDAMQLMVSETQRTETGPQPKYTAIAVAPFGVRFD